MNGHTTTDQGFYKAVTIEERSAALEANQAPPKHWHGLAMFRLRQWRAQSGLDDDKLFKKRLKADGLSQTSMAYVLAEPTGTLADRLAKPIWMEALEMMLSQQGVRPGDESLYLKGLTQPAGPMLRHGLAWFHQEVSEICLANPDLPFSTEKAERILFPRLHDLLLEQMGPLVASELARARDGDRLDGSCPKSRFKGFIDQLCEPRANLAFWKKWPVSARLVAGLIHRWT